MFIYAPLNLSALERSGHCFHGFRLESGRSLVVPNPEDWYVTTKARGAICGLSTGGCGCRDEMMARWSKI
jgi:hypothetical protein